MSVQLTPSKRQHDRSEPNGKGKWQKTASFNASFKIPHGSTVFRVLCPASKTGSVIGKGGNIISQIRQETGVKVRVEDTLPGCDERVIFIVGSDKENSGGVVSEQQSKDENNEETNKTEEEGDNNPKEGGDEADDEDNNKKSVNPVEDSETDNKGNFSAVQKALLLVFERMVEGDSEMMDGGGDEEESSNKSSSSTFVRLLVLSNQVGCLFGKGGSIIKQMSSESGAEIRILPREKLPACANLSDDLVQISGEIEAVRKALKSVSQQLIENPPRDSGPSSHSFGHRQQESSYPFPPQRGGPYGGGGPRDSESRMNSSPDILTFRLLCPDEKVGGVIGKGGSVVRGLQHETGCEIKVLDGIPGSDDRVIVISAPAHPDDGISAAQDAVLRVQARIVRSMPESKEKNVTARLLVPSYQIGCLLGKGGAIINEMRKLSGAYIRIVGKDQLPMCASENDELVQISGDIETVQEALMQITSRLREHLFRDAFPSMHHHGFPDQGPPFPPPYMGRREFSPPPFHSFNAGPPHGGFHPHDDRPPFMHHRPGFPPHISDRMPPPGPWGPQGLMEGGPMGMPDYAGPPRRIGGFGGGGHPAIITNTTVEVVVPRSVVPVIYGEDGGCLKQIREISDAKITITDPKPGASETMIIISGTPEQTHAAQSLIQAFVISESEGL